MRILVTVNCKWWNATAEGGFLQAFSLALRGHDVLVQTNLQPPAKYSDLPEKLEIVLSKPVFSLLPGGIFRFRKLVKRFKPDVVCCHRSEDQFIASVSTSRIPIIRIRSDIRKPSTGRFSVLVDSRTDLVVFPSAFMIRKGYAGNRSGPVAIIPQPVDTEYFRPTEKKKERLIISPGRLSPMKGHKTLIRALVKIPEARAVIAGQPAQQSIEELMNFAAEQGVENRLTLTGRIDDIRPLLSRAVLGVVTSLGSEAVSRAGMEIMASGIPLLAAATNSLLDLVKDGRTGLIHSPGDWETLARQVNWLLNRADIRRKMGKMAREYCISYLSPEIVGSMWEEIIGDMVK